MCFFVIILLRITSAVFPKKYNCGADLDIQYQIAHETYQLKPMMSSAKSVRLKSLPLKSLSDIAIVRAFYSRLFRPLT